MCITTLFNKISNYLRLECLYKIIVFNILKTIILYKQDNKVKLKKSKLQQEKKQNILYYNLTYDHGIHILN